MPVIIVGADTPVGKQLADRFADDSREVRAFVTDPDAATALRARGLKVALGDVSDDSHVAGASHGCFSAVLVAEAGEDERDRAFADRPAAVLEAWAAAVEAAGVKRVIWVGAVAPPPVAVAEVTTVPIDDPDLADTVFGLDAARTI